MPLGVGAVDVVVVGTTAVFAAGTGIAGGVSSPTSLTSLVLATDHEVCDGAGDPLCVGIRRLQVGNTRRQVRRICLRSRVNVREVLYEFPGNVYRRSRGHDVLCRIVVAATAETRDHKFVSRDRGKYSKLAPKIPVLSYETSFFFSSPRWRNFFSLI